MKTLILSFLTILFFVGCVSSYNTSTLYIAPYKANCVGVAPMKCLKVKKQKDDKWQLFYSNINGFKFEEGNQYIIKVKEEKRENVPADASSIIYNLVEIIEKKTINN
ncbi:hypothetical protein CRU99_09025 [Malaciobacter mytili]|uniref:DUF4377 domain-containing protein n=1 Tax=Malaciobacter mytili TaxID=603050 RepID=UPI00100BF97B|nr:DUF4377 domain-containing protein [Malaciobacter mytili]RXI42652.1 hypothetical protein CRU99_09025 [Malaciobacter mytili]